jgi:two-component system CheB/CheR fusion protein
MSGRPKASIGTCPVVGVGASAGGLEAFKELLTHLPVDTGMAFVLIQHLDPTHESFLVEALSKATEMPVGQVRHGEEVAPNRVYVIPPNADVGIAQGRLSLTPRQVDGRRLHLPVDSFFRALAAELGSAAIGVVLSGTASDGTEGLASIKAENGITFAQDPKTAKFGGMPHSAVVAGVADYCLEIPQIAAVLVRLSHHPFLATPPLDRSTVDDGVM